MPLMMAKKEIDAGCGDLSITVDNETARDNIVRLGKQSGLMVEASVVDGGYLVRLSDAGRSAGTAGSMPAAPKADEAPEGGLSTDRCLKGEPPASGQAGRPADDYAVFISKDSIGEGDLELGKALMKMALYTLSEAEQAPSALFFMNAGVKLLTGGDKQAVEHVQTLQGRGTEVMACGSCLDFYGLKEELLVGEVSNMYDILEGMRRSSMVITL